MLSRFAGASPWLGAIGLVVCTGALLAVIPLWAPIVLAGWTTIITWPLQRWLARRFRDSHRAAAVVTLAVLLAVLTPVVVVIVLSASSAMSLIRRVLASGGGSNALRAVVEGGHPEGAKNVEQIQQLVEQHGSGAWRALTLVVGATTTALIGAVVFVMFVYVFLVDGKRFLSWLEDHVPIPHDAFGRLAQAFSETGRGLFFGIGVTALVQGGVAAIGYFALGISQAAALGTLTVIAALIPMGGAALVWAPVTIGLFLSGRPGAGVIMLAIGCVVSTIDNVVRPALARKGHLKLPTSVVLAAMLGGIAMFGGWGLMLGPLFVRLAVEVLDILRDRRRADVDLPAV